MSVIEKLSIVGIRSFGPEDQNRQMIEFFHPLTLILGQNGTGKTTIIECLRYMTTGDAPPNSDRGGSFVHDPKYAGRQEVKGQVRLQFKDVVGQKVIVTRSMQVTQTLKKLTMKTLEGSIVRFNKNGEKSQLSSKCAEIDAEMIGSLGVSKAILNHVIFCHQEDSNWPLGEGKALKQKFDEIFAATRYIKALEEIRKIRIEKVSHIKLFQSEVDNLAKNKQKADEFQKELENTESRLLACRDSIQEVENKLQPVTDKIAELAEKQVSIGKLEAQHDTNLTIIKKCEKQEKDYRRKICDLFEGTKEDLKEEMKNFDVSVTEKKEKLEKVTRELSAVKKKFNADEKLKSQLTEELGKLKADHERYEENITQRDEKLRTMRSVLGLGDVGLDDDEPLDDSQVTNIVKSVKLRNSATKSEFSNLKKKHETAEQAMSKEVEKITVDKAKKQMELQSTNHQIAKNKMMIRNTNDELQRLEFLAHRQDTVEKDLKDAEEELNAIEGATNIDEMRENLSSKQSRKRELDTQLSDLNNEMKILHKESKTRFEIDTVTKDITSKRDGVESVLTRHKDTLTHLLQTVPERGLYDKIKKLTSELNKKIRDTNKALEKDRSKLSSLETTKSFHESQLTLKKEALNENQNKIFETCGSQDFEHGFESLKNNIKELQDEKGALTGSLYLYNKYLEKLKKARPCCPLCEQSFPGQQDAQDLSTKLQEKIRNIPAALEKKANLLAEKEKQLSKMLEMKPVKVAIANLLEKEIPELEKKLEATIAEITAANTKISETEEVLDTFTSDMKTASNITPDFILLDKDQREVERLSRRLTCLKTQITGSDTSRTVQIVSDEQVTTQNELKSLGTEIETMQQRIHDFQAQVQNYRSRINDLKAEKNQMCSDMQKKSQLVEKLETVTNENIKLQESTKKLSSDITTISEQLKKAVDEKQAVTKTKEQELDTLTKKIREEEKQMEGIEKITQEVDKYVRDKKEQKKIDHEDRMNTISTQIEEKRSEIKEKTALDKELTRDLDTQKQKKNDLDDNMRLIETIEEIGELRSKCQALKEEIGGFNLSSLKKEMERYLKQEKELRKEQNEASGRETMLKEKIKDYKKQLRDDMFNDAEKKHKNKYIELRTNQLAIEDLSKYYTALNKAIMSYHQLKMKEINKIIKDLWYKTYAGSDIDYIEIQSDEDKDAGLEKARRTFNYRVVMVKGDIVTDMRGRCSAGQKVLASLIIRLALAETFCLNCGILALDEPTTNLDSENIHKLASSLREIVIERSEQRNFQLIVITHDSDFIQLLGNDYVEHYYKVSKDNNSFSKVTKLCIR